MQNDNVGWLPTGWRGRMTVPRVDHHDREVTVTADWVGNHFTRRFAFQLDGDLVRELRITGRNLTRSRKRARCVSL